MVAKKILTDLDVRGDISLTGTLDGVVLSVKAPVWDSKADGVHTHDAEDIISGTFSTNRIPNLNASKITAGTFDIARIPTITVAKGGTGLTSFAAGGILYASSANTFSRIAPSAAGQVLRSTGANALSISALTASDIPNLPPAKITQDASNRFVTDVEKAAWNAKSNFSGNISDLGINANKDWNSFDITNIRKITFTSAANQIKINDISGNPSCTWSSNPGGWELLSVWDDIDNVERFTVSRYGDISLTGSVEARSYNVDGASVINSARDLVNIRDVMLNGCIYFSKQNDQLIFRDGTGALDTLWICRPSSNYLMQLWDVKSSQEKLRVDRSGNLFLKGNIYNSNMVGFTATMTTAQTVPPNTWTEVTLMGEEFDPNGVHSNGVFTAPTWGYYLLGGAVTLNDLGAGRTCYVRLDRDRAATFAQALIQAAADGPITSQVQTIAYLNKGSAVRLGVHHNAGGNKSIIQTVETRFYGYLLTAV